MILTEGRWAELIEVSNDKGPYKIARVQSEGHEFDVHIIDFTGMQSNPLKESQVFVLPTNTDTGQAVGFALPPPAKRVDQQKEGEVTYMNHLRGQYMKLDDEGNIILKPLPGKKVLLEGTDGSKVELQIKADVVQSEGNLVQQDGGISSTGAHQAAGGHI